MAHTFNWDTFASGFFGQSDNVRFRIIAYPGASVSPNGAVGPYHRPYVSATTFPFRARGTQVLRDGCPERRQARRIAVRHPIGNHSDSHPPLPTIVAELKRRGYGFVTIDDSI